MIWMQIRMEIGVFAVMPCGGRKLFYGEQVTAIVDSVLELDL